MIMSSMDLDLPTHDPDFLLIISSALKLYDDREEFILPNKRAVFEMHIEEIKEEYVISWSLAGYEAFLAHSRFVDKFNKEIRLNSNGNWEKVRSRCLAFNSVKQRLQRRRELQHPSTEESFERELWWMTENSSPEDLDDLRHVRLAPAFISEEKSRLLSMAVQRCLSRADNLDDLNPLLAACLNDANLSEPEKVDLLNEILHATELQTALLMELAENRECHSVYRWHAIWRLVELAPSQTTWEFLRLLFDPQETDEDVRVWAYKKYRYLRIATGCRMTKTEMADEKQRGSMDRNLRLQWLMAMRD